MSNGVISFMFAAGAATWLFTKFQRYSGNNSKQSVMAAAVSGVVIFIVFLLILNMIIK